MSTRRVATGVISIVGVLASMSGANGATTEYSTQKLDRIDIASKSNAVNIGRDTDLVAQPWETSTYDGVSGSSLNVCQNTSAGGMYCLDGSSVKRWETPAKVVSGDGVELFSCANTKLGLDKGGLCTALAVDVAGNIWVAGKRNNSFSLFKVTKGTCPAPVANTPPYRQITSDYCAQEYASGRPILIDLTLIEGDAADAFPLDPSGGVLAVEARKEVTYFKNVAGAPPVTIAAGKAWGLAGSEQLQSATLLQELLPEDSINWILVTTSTGRVLAKRLRWDNTPTVVHPYTAAKNVDLVSTTTCLGAPTDPLYRIRASSKSGDVYVTDRRGCRLIALDPQIAADPLTFGPQDVIAGPGATTPDAVLTIAPESLSISPGIDVDLYADCGPGKTCILVGHTEDTPAPGASLSNVNVIPTAPNGQTLPTGLTVFQIKDFPDCRYIALNDQPAECKDPTNPAILKADGNPLASADYDGAGLPNNPQQLFLNIRPLLPREVTDVFTQSDKFGSLPPKMLLSPRYRGAVNDETFDGLFGVTDTDIRFRDTFTAAFDVSDLIGTEYKLGCGGVPFNSTDGPPWDVVVTMSERYTTVGGLSGGVVPQFTDMLINKGCSNPTSGSGSRWSLYAYGLKLAKDSGIDSNGAPVVEYPDTTFARLVLSLSKDLTDTIARYLCVNADPGGNVAPVGQPMCSSLKADWDNTAAKLERCVLASTDPKRSSENQNCQSFESQYLGYKTYLDSVVLSGEDPANRLGEVRARTDVLRYVYDSQYKPTIPATGFTDGIAAP